MLDTALRPLDWQKQVIQAPERFKVLVVHRGAGKTFLACMDLLINLLLCKNPSPQAAFIAPEKGQAKDICFPIFRRLLKGLSGVKFIDTSNETFIELPDGRKIFILGVKDQKAIASIRGIYLDYAVFDEFGYHPVGIFKAIGPCLTRFGRSPGKALFVGTPCGANQFYDFYRRGLDDTAKEWASFKFTIYETQMYNEDTIESFKQSLSHGEFEQEYLGEFFANSEGKYYAEIMRDIHRKGQIDQVSHNPALPVYTAWDIGMSDATAIWFAQIEDKKIRIIDYYTNANKGLDYYSQVVIAKKYHYDYHYMPHDIRQINNSTGKSRLTEVKSYLEVNGRVKVAPKLHRNDGINAVRSILPMCHFDRERCRDGILALENYQSKVVRGIVTDEPIHDQFSHAADAFRYLAVCIKPRATSSTFNSGDFNYDPFSKNNRKSDDASDDYNPLSPNMYFEGHDLT